MFNPLEPPKPGEWLWENLEEPQSFDQYTGGKNVRLVQNKREIIFIQPIISDNTYLSKRLIGDIKKFVKAFFYGCKIVQLDSQKESVMRENPHIEHDADTNQYSGSMINFCLS